MKQLIFILILLFSLKKLSAQTVLNLTSQDSLNINSILEIMENEDQKYRTQLSAMWKSKSVDSIEYKKIENLVRIIDSINQIRLDSLQALYGIEYISRLGRGKVFIIVQHAPLEFQIKYLPTFKKLYSEGKFSGQEVGMLEDRILIRYKKKQIYGSQICKNPKTNEAFVCPLEEPDKVDIRRKEMGFPINLNEYCKYFNFEWNLEDYKKRLPEYIEIEKNKVRN